MASDPTREALIREVATLRAELNALRSEYHASCARMEHQLAEVAETQQELRDALIKWRGAIPIFVLGGAALAWVLEQTEALAAIFGRGRGED